MGKDGEKFIRLGAPEVPPEIDRAEGLFLRGRCEQGLAVLDAAVRRLGDAPDGWMAVLVPAMKFAQCFERSALLNRWLRLVERRWMRLRPETSAAREAVGEEISVLRLWVQWKTLGPGIGMEPLDEAFAQIRHWKPWMVQFQWDVLLNFNRFDAVDESISRGPPCRIERGTITYGARILTLALKFYLQMRSRPAEVLFRSAIRKLEEVPGFHSHFMRAAAYCRLAWIYRIRGEYRAGLELLRKAEAIDRRINSRSLRSLRSQSEGTLSILTGDYEGATRRFLIDRDPGRPAVYSRRVSSAHAVLTAAYCQLQMGHHARAERYVRRAKDLLRGQSLSHVHGTLHMVRGDIKLATGDPADLRAAGGRYDKAERVYRATGAPPLYLSLLYARRGAYYLKRQNYQSALRCAEVSGLNGSDTGGTPFWGESFLLKSFLLLETGMPHAHLYEEVLKGLGTIQDPVTLFKTIANLYIYTWDLGDFLDLTDLHMKQIEKLRERLEPELFARLYRMYITERVVERMRKRFGTAENVKLRRVSAP